MSSVPGIGGQLPVSAAAMAPVAMMGELLPDGLVVIGADQLIRFVNAEALRILACDSSELVGRRLEEALPLTDKYGADWWAHTDPWGELDGRAGHPEKLLVAPKGQDVLVTARYLRSEEHGGVER